MKNLKTLVRSAVFAGLLVGFIGLTGCSGVSPEQMAELENLRTEVSEMTKQINTLKSEKSKLERDLAERKAKLDQCEKDKAATKANLQKMGN
ncbi:MAG: hypothetical protein K9I71_08190 [Ignavibacteriales bacterium]|nr:hypothetical protein [Ignavibacteriales bacterium]MCF8316090.1 hypothetical protein [Ignavibacteriales bacterium]MCF8436592.1 hypothetical protein [Ignavibacteriales bacterium]